MRFHTNAAGLIDGTAAYAEPKRSAKHRRAAGKHRGPDVGRVLLSFGVILGLLFFLGARQAAITEMSYDIAEQKQQLEQMKSQRDALQAQVARLSAPGRVEAEALALGMKDAPGFEIATVTPLERKTPVPRPTRTAVVSLPPGLGAVVGSVSEKPQGFLDRVVSQMYAWLTGSSVQARSIR